MIGVAMLVALIGAICLGFPMAFTLLAVVVLFGTWGLGARVFDLMVFQTVSLLKEEVLAAVPLFIFMGYVVEQSGLMERLFRAFQLIFAPVRGSLYLAVILTAVVFAMATGIVGAAVTVLGIMAGNTMIKSRYDVKLSAGVITAGGTLGILIPPSVMLVVMGPVVGVSVAKLYAAAFGPGLLLAAIYLAYAMVRSYLRPELGPALPLDERASLVMALRECLFGMVPLGILIFATLGSILAGLATPTEASAMGASGSLLLTACYARLTWRRVKDATFKTLETSSMILFLVLTSNFFGSVFARLGTATLVTNTLLGLALPPIVMLLVLNVIIFVLGWPFEWPTIVLVFLPILLPIVKAMNYDLLWFSVLVAVNLQTTFLSPPVAMSAYYLKAVVPQWELTEIIKGMLAFLVLQVIGLLIVMLFPPLTTWLPNRLFP
ncbi:MAG: TRAP transporter large permease subunit [Candidatus Rokubacteria bacterium]|nr:TRAP transporter large permease subunit [Candidatus Rokubacteria bacterium]